MSVSPTFKLNTLYFPRLDGSFLKTPKSEKYIQSHRVGIQIAEDQKITVLFGVSLQSEEQDGSVPLAQVVAEVAAEIELGGALPAVSQLSDIPLMANMLALLYPFLREKVNYFFSSNHLHILLLPINTFQIVQDPKFAGAVTIVDGRLAKDNSELSSSPSS